MKFSSFKKNLREKAKADTRTCGQVTVAANKKRNWSYVSLAPSLYLTNLGSKCFFLRLTLFIRIMANGYNFSIFMAID